MLSTSQREHLTYTLIWQCLTLAAIWILSWHYILPGFAKISTNIEKAETTINSYVEIRDKGYDYSRLTGVLWGMGNKEELIKIIQATPDQTKVALQKVGTQEYLTWLKNAINASDEDKKKLIQAKKKINSILPTMSPMSANIDEENVTLKEYILYIEKEIFKKFDLDNNMSLWIQNVVYGNAWNGMPSGIGTFDLRLDFRTTNENIKKLIDYVNQSGNADILTQSGILSDDQIPEIMSNPLLTLEAFSLQFPLDLKNPDKINTGRATIRFYVRGSSSDDVTFLRENLQTRKDALLSNINSAVSECQKNEVLCSQLDSLKAFQKKYNEFLRWLNTNYKFGGLVDEVYGLTQQVNALRTLEQEFETFNIQLSK